MIRRPPRSTLFPSRRSSDLTRSGGGGADCRTRAAADRRAQPLSRGGERRASRRRSEEHTSELQSHVNLVCRLLLEKKKKQTRAVQTPARTGPETVTHRRYDT